ncbi:MAG: MFS transporter [Bacteroidota bacterium]|nr:MFS transporter [Bacteroidota bacterium]
MELQIGNYRWRILVFLFFATTINYIDRQIIGILAPTLQKNFNWTEKDYGLIIMGFQIAYAIGLLTMGNLLDRIGTKWGYSIAIAIWSIAGMFHAGARSVVSFVAARFVLGIGESANFPAAIKTVTEWFPKKERALATGIFNSGSNIGAMITPLVIPFIALHWNWKTAFLLTGSSGFIWLLFWIAFYKRPEKETKLSDSERTYILQDGKESGEPGECIPLKKVLWHKQTLGICLARFVTDPIWWFFLFWLPKFLDKNYGIKLDGLGLPLFVVYTLAIGGSVFGGWLSSHLIGNGWQPVRARKLTIFLLALMVVPIFFASMVSNLWVAVTLVTMAAFAHQGYASNIYTIVSDIYPKKVVGTMVGIAGFAGALGGILFAYAVGVILDITGSYYLIFGIASSAYLICWAALKLFVPDNERIEV